MDNRIYLINLYDIYKNLLTDKQQAYFEDYYFNNLSLQEMSSIYNISRNAVHKQLKDTEAKIIHYENTLLVYNKGNKIKELIKDLDTSLKDKIEELL
jgi:uncharacterized protein